MEAVLWLHPATGAGAGGRTDEKFENDIAGESDRGYNARNLEVSIDSAQSTDPIEKVSKKF